MEPIRCPVSCASTSATWNRQSTRRDTFSSARYSCSVSTTRVGFFSVGVPEPLTLDKLFAICGEEVTPTKGAHSPHRRMGRRAGVYRRGANA